MRYSIKQWPNLINIVGNLGWLFFDNILRMGVGVIVGVWIARYLGPEQFGLLNFATAAAGIFSAFASLGLQGVVVRELVQNSKYTQEILGTAAVLQFLGGTVAYLFLIVAIALMRPDNVLVMSIVSILGSTMLFKSSDIVIYWFESKVQYKYVVWIQNGVFVLFSIIKILLILLHVPLIVFVWTMFGEALILSSALLLFTSNHVPSISSLDFRLLRARLLLKDCWPLIISSIAISIYMKIDQIMLAQMVGDDAVGVYSAATRISEVWYFIPTAIISSVFPKIMEAKIRSETEYCVLLQRLYNVMVIISVSIAIVVTCISTPIVNTIYGETYTEAAEILAIHVWASVFVFLGVVSGKSLLAENRQLIGLQRVLLGGIANIGLNLILIPNYHAIGAAIATLISYSIAGLFADILQKSTRKMFIMKINAFNPIAIIEGCR